MLMRCTGSLLVKQTPQERIALSDHVRKVLESVGEQFHSFNQMDCSVHITMQEMVDHFFSFMPVPSLVMTTHTAMPYRLQSHSS